MNIGLADWHIYEMQSGYKTALRQTKESLMLIAVRPDVVEWRVYSDVHGMNLHTCGTAETLERAQEACENVIPETPACTPDAAAAQPAALPCSTPAPSSC
jgi:hypothetical protein